LSKIKLSLLSILEAIGKIENYTNEFDNADDFYHDEKSFDATMMQFVIIGEMISKLDEDFKEKYSNIPWQKVKDFRNIVAHNYFGIDADEIWEIITTKIKPLKYDIKGLLDKEL
jgi:uncharacterized protein with HEPN domain